MKILTDKLKKEWLNYLTNTLNIYKSQYLDDFTVVTDYKYTEISKLLKMGLVVKFELKNQQEKKG